MKNKNTILIGMLLLVLTLSFIVAVPWTPSGNVDLKNYYNMTNLNYFDGFTMLGNLSYDADEFYITNGSDNYFLFSNEEEGEIIFLKTLFGEGVDFIMESIAEDETFSVEAETGNVGFAGDLISTALSFIIGNETDDYMEFNFEEEEVGFLVDGFVDGSFTVEDGKFEVINESEDVIFKVDPQAFTVEVNDGWSLGGVSIIDGDIYAHTGYFYNITALGISTLNINGSLLPAQGYDNTFDIGNSTLRWRYLYLGEAGSLENNIDGDVPFKIENTNSGSNAQAYLQVESDSAKGQFIATSLINSNAPNTVALIADSDTSKILYLISNATGYHTFHIGDGNEEMNLTTTGLDVAHNVTASYFIGDGSYLTGISGGNASWNQSLADTLYAKYQFTNNNFNGSGNFSTTGGISLGTEESRDWSIDIRNSSLYPTIGFYDQAYLNFTVIGQIGPTSMYLISPGSSISFRELDSYGMDASEEFINFSSAGIGVVGNIYSKNITLADELNVGDNANIEDDIYLLSSGSKIQWSDVNESTIRAFRGSAENFMEFNLFSQSPTDSAKYRFFTDTNTTGDKFVYFLKGDGTYSVDAKIGVDGGDSYFQNGGGNFAIGEIISPVGKLSVDGDVLVNTNVADANSEFVVRVDTDYEGMAIKAPNGPRIFFDEGAEGSEVQTAFLGLQLTDNSFVMRNWGGSGDDILFSIQGGGGRTSAPDADIMTLLYNRKVGINTTYPTHELNVVGTINATYYIGDGSELTGVAKYQFTNNNFNGSGNFTTTGGGISIGTEENVWELDIRASASALAGFYDTADDNFTILGTSFGGSYYLVSPETPIFFGELPTYEVGATPVQWINFTSAGIGVDGNGYFVENVTTNKIFIGGITDIPYGIADMQIDGPMQMLASADDYPAISMYSFAHGNSYLGFDIYWDIANFDSSNANYNAMLSVIADKITFGYDTGNAQGSAYNEKIGWQIDMDDGSTTFGNTTHHNGNIIADKHLIGNSATPTLTAWTGAGSSPSVTTIEGSDIAGEVVISTGTSCATAVVYEVTYNQVYLTKPYVVFAPSSSNSARLAGDNKLYVSSSTLIGFNISTNGALSDSTQYKWTYHVIE